MFFRLLFEFSDFAGQCLKVGLVPIILLLDLWLATESETGARR